MPRANKPANKWFDLVAASNGEPTKIYLYGNIGLYDIEAQDMIEALKPHAGEDIFLHVLSRGGSVFQGQAIYAALTDHKGKITGVIDSVCASITSFIIQACDEIYIRPFAQVMIHECRGGASGTADELRTTAAMYDEVNASMAEAIATKSGKNVEDVRNDMRTDFWLRGQAAVDYGICDGLYGSDEPKQSLFDSEITAENIDTFTIPTAELLQAVSAPSELVAMYGNPKSAKTAPPQTPNAEGKTQMTEEEKKALKAQLKSELLAELESEEGQRSDGITALFAAYADKAGVKELQASCLGDKAVSVENAKDRLIALLANPTASQQTTPAPVVNGDVNPNASKLEELEAALHHKMGAENVEISAKNPYRFLDAKSAIRSYYSAAGDLEQANRPDQELIAFGFNNGTGSGDLAPIFERGIKRIIRDEESKFKPWIHNVVTRMPMDIGRANVLLKSADTKAPRVKTEHGEFAQIKLEASREVVWLATEGYEISVTRELIMADQLSFIKTEVSKYVYRCSLVPQMNLINMLKTNANLADNEPIFHTKFENLVESAEFDAAAIDSMSGSMKDMTTKGGEDLGLTPKYLLTSGRGESKAKALISTDIIDNKPNVAYEAFETVIGTGQLAKANKCFGFADPHSLTGIIEGYNEQAQGVQFETKEGWKSDGATFRIYIDSVVQIRDRRALQAWHKKSA